MFLPFFTECRQLTHGLFFCICLIYLLEVFHEFLDVFIAHKSGAAADLVDDASLYPCLGINSRDCFFEAGKTVYAEQRKMCIRDRLYRIGCTGFPGAAVPSSTGQEILFTKNIEQMSKKIMK